MKQPLRHFAIAAALWPAPSCDHAAPEPAATDQRPRFFADAIDPAILPYYGDASFTPLWADSTNELPPQFHRVPSFSLTNQNGEDVTEATFVGRAFVTNFFFTSCSGVCRKMNINLARVQEAVAADDGVMFLSHSVTPDVDTPAVLRNYGQRFGSIPGKWHLVTGDREQIYALGRDAYFVEEDQGRTRTQDAFLHSENFVLVDADRHLRGIYDGLNTTDVDRLIRDLRTLRAAERVQTQLAERPTGIGERM